MRGCRTLVSSSRGEPSVVRILPSLITSASTTDVFASGSMMNTYGPAVFTDTAVSRSPSSSGPTSANSQRSSLPPDVPPGPVLQAASATAPTTATIATSRMPLVARPVRADFPDHARVHQLREIARALLGDRVFDLLVRHLVVGRLVVAVQHAHRHREVRRHELREQIRVEQRTALGVDEQLRRV